jgi:hypothetical protein
MFVITLVPMNVLFVKSGHIIAFASYRKRRQLTNAAIDRVKLRLCIR